MARSRRSIGVYAGGAALSAVVSAGGCGILSTGLDGCPPGGMALAEKMSGLDALSEHPVVSALVGSHFGCDSDDRYAYAVSEYRSSLSPQSVVSFYADFLKRDGWEYRPSVVLPSGTPQREADGVSSMFKKLDGTQVEFEISFGDSEHPLKKSDRYFVQAVAPAGEER